MNRGDFLAGIASLPLLAAVDTPGAAGIDGEWLGTLSYGTDSETFALAFKKGKAGKLVAYMWNPAIGVYDLPASHVAVRNDTVTLVEAKLPLHYDGVRLTGKLSPIGDRIALARATEPLPATPAAPAPVVGMPPSPIWQQHIGPVWAAPVASDGVIYVGDARGSLHAFDARTGAIAWTYDTKSSIFGVPALDGEALLVLDSRDVVHRIEMKSGKRIWARVLGNGRPHDVPSPKSRQFDYRSAMPALHDGTAYVGTGSGTFYALDAARGSVVWQQRMGHAIRSTAAVAGGRAIFGTWDGNVVALDLKTGESAWKLATGQPISMAVVVYKNVAIVGSRNTLLYGIDIGSGKPVWKRYYFTSWIESAPTIVDGIAYMGSSDLHTLRAFDPLTGSTWWQTTVYGWSAGTPLIAGGIVYAGTAAMAPYLPNMLAGRCALRADDGSLLWRDAKEPETGIVTGYACDPVRSGNTIVYASVTGDVRAYAIG